MKVYKKNFKELFFELGIESLDDLWVLSLFINEGDVVGSQTTRRFRAQDSDESEKKKVFINLEVKNCKLDLDLQVIKIIGVIISGSPAEFVNVGEHHSFDLTIGDSLKINKKVLLDLQKKLLTKSLESKSRSKIFLIVLDDDSAIIARLNENKYTTVADIPFKGSGKRDSSQRVSNRTFYFDSILKVLESEDYDNIIVGGPGFEKENLQKYIADKITDAKKKSKFIFTQIASPGISGIKELIKGGALKKILSGLSVQRDSELLDEFMLDLAKDKPVTYGLSQIKDALNRNALKSVIISDKFFKDDFNNIKNLLLSLENNKIEYHIVASDSEPGRILDNMTGIAAFLYY